MTGNSEMPNSKRKVTLPGSIRDFVERQATLPLESLFEDTDAPIYPYCEYWRRAVAAMPLSGRIAAKDDGFPNMTDVNRICKEANFDQYLFEATGRFLITAKIIQVNQRNSRYDPAKFSDAFWNHQFQKGLACRFPQRLELMVPKSIAELGGLIPGTLLVGLDDFRGNQKPARRFE